MTTPTLNRPTTIRISDADGYEQSLLHIDGQALEDYFADTGLKLEAGQVAIIDGAPADIKAPVRPGELVSIANKIKNG